MYRRLAEFLQSLLAYFEVYIDRQRRGNVKGHDLRHDLTCLITQANPVCFDVGANRGQTIDLLQRCLKAPVIHSFEPAATPFQELAKRSFGGVVHLHQLAFGDTPGEAEFYNYFHSELGSFLPMNPDRAENFFAEVPVLSTESVRVDTLDHFCAEQQIGGIDLLKIDTQGFEMPVLRGAEGLFRAQKIKAVLLEMNFAVLYQEQSDPLAIFEFMRTHQFRLVDFYEKERISSRELSWATALFIHQP